MSFEEECEAEIQRMLRVVRLAQLSDAELMACGLTRGAAAVIDTAVLQVLSAALAVIDLELSLIPELMSRLIDRTKAAERLVANVLTVLTDRGILSAEDLDRVKALTNEQAATQAIDGLFDVRAENFVEAVRRMLERFRAGLTAPAAEARRS